MYQCHQYMVMWYLFNDIYAIQNTQIIGCFHHNLSGFVLYACRWVLLRLLHWNWSNLHNSEVTINAMASQITGVSIVCSTVYSDADQRTHQNSASLAFVRGIPRSPVNSHHKGQWRGALIFSLICAWINGWVNNGEAGDLRPHRAHYDVIVMP